MSERGSARRALVATLGGLALALVLIAFSDGFYHDDDLEHYFFALDGWSNVDKALHWWARPGYNLPAMVVAHFFGLVGCRVFSALMSAAVAWLAYLIACEIARARPRAAGWIWAAPALVWIQPLVMTLAETTLTETPAALYLALGVWLWLRGRRAGACAALSLVFVTRLETLVLLPFFALAVWVRCRRGASLRAWFAPLLLLWAPLAWLGACYLLGVWRDASPLGLLARETVGIYGQGTWYHFLLRWLLASGLGAVVLFFAGLVRLGRRALLPAAVVLGLVLVHTLLYRFNRFDSGGYGRFLVPAAGPLAAVAAVGLGTLSRGWRRAALAVALVQFIAVVRPLTLYYPVASPAAGPRTSLFEQIGALAWVRPLAVEGMLYNAVMVEALERAGPPQARADREIWRTHIVYRYLVPGARKVVDDDHGIAVWAGAPPGALMLWDNKYGGPEGGAFHAALKAGGRLLGESRHGWAHAAIYERLARGQRSARR